MGEMVRVAPQPVGELAARLDATGLQLSELSCRARAVAADLGCVPAAGRLSDVGAWCGQAGDALRELVARARQVDDEAATAVSVAGLGGVWERATPPRDPLREVGRGAWESLVGAAETFNDLTVQALWDPAGWWADLGDVGEGMVASATDPAGAVRAVVDLDTLKDNPARWAGRLVPDAVAGVLSGGTVTAGRRGVDMADTLANVGRRAPQAATAAHGHLPPAWTWARRASEGPRLSRFIASLPRGRSSNPAIRVMSVDDLDLLLAEIQRHADAGPHPRHPDGIMYQYPDGTRVGVRNSGRHGLTLDIAVDEEVRWKVHIDGS